MMKKPGCGCGGEDKGGMPPMMGMMKEMMGRVFSSRSSLYHYLNMAKGNFRLFCQCGC